MRSQKCSLSIMLFNYIPSYPYSPFLTRHKTALKPKSDFSLTPFDKILSLRRDSPTK